MQTDIPVPEHSLQYYPARGISTETREFLNIVTRVAANGEPFEDIVTFPNGTQQIRGLKDKTFRTAGPHASEPTLMFMDKYPPGSAKTVTITEGAYDAASIREALGPNFPAVSVRSSSSARKDCVAHFKYLDSFDKIYLALDADEPGQKAARQIAELFDFNKVFNVDLGQLKDANGYLQAGLGNQLRQVWHNAKKYLPEGIVNTREQFAQILKDKKSRPSIPMPWDNLQAVTKGIRGSEVILITAQEGVGKTEFIRHLEYHILTTTNHNIGIIHLEEPKADQIERLAGLHLKVPAHFEGVTSDEEVLNAIDQITKNNPERLHIYSHFDTDDLDVLLGTIRFLVTSCGCQYIFLDHITLLVTGQGKDDERLKLDYLSTRLELMVQNLGFTLFLVSHVNDDGQTRGSRNIGKTSMTRIDLSRNLVAEDPAERAKLFMTVSKNRHGSTTGPAGVLHFDAETFTYSDKGPIVPVPAE